MHQTVWIARHGNRLDFVNPEWFNTAARRYDPPLSEDGFVQAAELGQRLKFEQIDEIFSSPFLRTIQTANEVAQVLQLPIKLEAGLSEWHNQAWMSESPEIHPQDFLAREYPLIDWEYQSCQHPQYPESAAEVDQRVAATVQHLTAKFTTNILIVGHGASVFGATKGLVPDAPEFRVPLCSLTKVVRTPDCSWELELCADTSYLSQTESKVRLN
ncbi:MAG: histidine phosphatase family protein [Cyanobacteria bacterium P01_A01_bin.83]